jgi:hypothetical protein
VTAPHDKKSLAAVAASNMSTDELISLCFAELAPERSLEIEGELRTRVGPGGMLSAPSTIDTTGSLKIAARLEKRINTDTTIEPLSNHEQLDHDAAQMIRKLAALSARNAIIEECAVECERAAEADHDGYTGGERAGFRMAAYRIRALSDGNTERRSGKDRRTGDPQAPNAPYRRMNRGRRRGDGAVDREAAK